MAVGAANGRLQLSWTPPDDGGAPISSYQVAYSITGQVWLTGPEVSGTSTSATLSSLTNGMGYYVRVQARNAAGSGAWSVAQKPYFPYTIPGVSPSMTAVARSRSAKLHWVAAPDGGSRVTGYAIQITANHGRNWRTSASASAAVRDLTVTGLRPGMSYQFRVLARNLAGYGAPSKATPQVVPYTTPSAPKALVGLVSDDGVYLHWVSGSNGGRRIVGYRILVSYDAGSRWTTVVNNTHRATTSATVTAIRHGNAAWFRVAAINSAGVGAPSMSTHRLVA